ncbi:MAG: Smg protein [Alphaproteobacteria bacterium]|jgi:Smg protein
MYLFENLVNHEADIMVDQDELTDELIRAGFHHDEIFKALAWLEKLCDLQSSDETPYLTRVTEVTSTRIYTIEEQVMLDVECRGFLIFLEQINVLCSSTREMVIDRVMEIDSNEFCLVDFKWVVLMVLFNVPGKELAYEQMEELIFDCQEGYLH